MLLAWIGREVKIKKEREIQLGKSLAGFMGDLGMTTQSGGKNGNITRLRDQMKRTFSAKIAIMDNPDVVSSFEASDWRNEGFNLVDRSQIWWDPTSPTQSNLFESHIQLSERFYDELVNNPVPVDMRALRALRASPSSLDLYCFLTYRAFNLKRTTTVPWEALKMQFGSEIANDRKFRWQFREALKSVMVVYPEARADLSDTGLILQPSRTSVPRRVEK
ncbi:MAG TPA: replication protein RepA [Schlesneria sp.]